MAGLLSEIPQKETHKSLDEKSIGHFLASLPQDTSDTKLIDTIAKNLSSSEKSIPAIKETLHLLLKDDMTRQSRTQKVAEIFRGVLGNIGGVEDKRTQSNFQKAALKALHDADQTNEVQIVVYNKNDGYTVFGRETLSKQALTKPEETNITLFQRLLSDTNYKERLKNVFGTDGLQGIGLYVLSRHGQSNLINGMAQDRIDYILSFGTKINEKIKQFSGMSQTDFPKTQEILKKLGKGIEIKFDSNGSVDFVETFGEKNLNPEKLNTIAQMILEESNMMSQGEQTKRKQALGEFRKLNIKGYDEVQGFYREKGAKDLELFDDLKNIPIGASITKKQISNILLFLEKNTQLDNLEVTKQLKILIGSSTNLMAHAGTGATARTVIKITDNPTSKEAAKLADSINKKDKNLDTRLKATADIGSAREAIRQNSETTGSDPDIQRILDSLKLGDYDTIVSDSIKLSQAITILTSTANPTIAERRLLSIFQKVYQKQKEITEDIVTIRRSLPPEERKDINVYISSAFDKVVSSKDVEQYTYASRYHYKNDGDIGATEQKIADMTPGTSLQLSGVLLAPLRLDVGGNTDNSTNTLSHVTIFAPEQGKRSIIYNGHVLTTLPIMDITGYIQSLSDTSLLGMNQLFPDLENMYASITHHTGKTLSGADGDYSEEEYTRFLQCMYLVCYDTLPTNSHDRHELMRPFQQTHGTSIISHFEETISGATTTSGNPIWNKENRRINITAWDEKVGEIVEKLPLL